MPPPPLRMGRAYDARCSSRELHVQRYFTNTRNNIQVYLIYRYIYNIFFFSLQYGTNFVVSGYRYYVICSRRRTRGVSPPDDATITIWCFRERVWVEKSDAFIREFRARNLFRYYYAAVVLYTFFYAHRHISLNIRYVFFFTRSSYHYLIIGKKKNRRWKQKRSDFLRLYVVFMRA